jgi:hypothetical protein
MWNNTHGITIQSTTTTSSLPMPWLFSAIHKSQTQLHIFTTVQPCSNLKPPPTSRPSQIKPCIFTSLSLPPHFSAVKPKTITCKTRSLASPPYQIHQTQTTHEPPRHKSGNPFVQC